MPLIPNLIKIVIADDHEIFRDGLALMLNKQPHFTLCAQAEDGNELIQIVKRYEPDVILTDIKMPRLDGIAATMQILKLFPDTKVIALSMFDEESLIVDMLEAGAKGYLLKNADKQEILDAIHDVYNDKVYYCRSTSARLASLIVKSKFSINKKQDIPSFTDREKEIIKLICKQMTAQEIGDQLFLSKRTVEGYRVKILEKMNVKNTAGVVVYALKNNLIKEQDIFGTP